MPFVSHASAWILLLLAIPKQMVTANSNLDHYAGYLPSHSVTDLAAIDQDQYDVNEELAKRKVTPAMRIYREGGHSGSFAILTLSNVNTAGNFPQGTKVFGISDKGEDVIGHLQRDASWTASMDEDSPDPELYVTYEIGSRQDTYSDCNVGGLYTIKMADRDGCFTGSGELRLGNDYSTAQTFTYSYDVRVDNENTITIQSFSTEAQQSMKVVGNTYFPEYQAFVNYYGDYDYADKFIESAHNAQHTNFKTARGNLDFSLFQDRMGRAEAMKKGMVYLNIWMESVKYLYQAVDLCHEVDAVKYLDQAVALYTGSFTIDQEETGILIHGLADVRAHQFKTAGHQGDKDTGTSYVNIRVMDSFRTLKQILESADPDLCDKAVVTRDYIMTLLKIPLIQGLLRYTYKREFEMEGLSLDDTERTMGESATFAATVLPYVHECSPQAAVTIHENVKIGARRTSYAAVHRSVTSVYDCMGITDCEWIGGIWDRDQAKYLEYGLPCGRDVDGSIQSRSPVAGFFRFVGISCGILVAAYFLLKYKNRILAYVRRTRQQHTLPKTQFTGNIAAVAEIS